MSQCENSVSPKTPVSLLQEICVKRGFMPRYELTQIEGEVHTPKFTFRVTADGQSGEGTSTTKKQAKHAAAINLLKKFGDVVPKAESVKINSTSKEFDADPIGALQAYCLSKEIPVPVFKDIREEGPPHNKTFEVRCSLSEKIVETGIGKTKKEAKKCAAHKAFTRLKEELESFFEIRRSVTPASEEEMAEPVRCPEDLKPDNQRKKVGDFMLNLSEKTGKYLEELRDIEFSMNMVDPIHFMNELSKEQKFRLDFLEMGSRKKGDPFVCLSHIGDEPLFCVFGSGKTPEEAKLECAKNCITYLQLILQFQIVTLRD